MPEVTHVKIAEVKTGKPGDSLKATLGSCIGIAFLWKRKGICGLAHCLLPETNEVQTIISAKFINHAVPSLMTLMKIHEEDIMDIEVHIAGGGNMMSQLNVKNKDDIGTQNIAAVKKILSRFGFKIRTEDTGGIYGRQIYLDCTEQTVRVEKLERAGDVSVITK